MTPQPNFYTILRRIVYQIFQLLIRPTVPKSINRIILISQFTCQSGKFFHILQCTCTTIQPTPYRTSRPNPIRIYTFGKKILIRRWSKVRYQISIHQLIQIISDHHCTPRSRNCTSNGSRIWQTPGLFQAVIMGKRISCWLGMSQLSLKTILTIGL